MMHAIGVALRAYLVSTACPIAVVDGPELTEPNTHARERIVIEHAPDTFGPAKSQHQNPKHALTRVVGGKITIYAQSARASATRSEHEERCDAILDQVLAGLFYVSRARQVRMSLKGGSFQPIADLAKSPNPHGAKYELLFSFDRGVAITNFGGGHAAEVTLGPGGPSITSTTSVRLANGPEDTPPATACGDGD